MRNRTSKHHKRISLFVVAVLTSLTVVCIATLAAGVLDPGFGTSGRVLTAMGGADVINALVIQSDGKIVAVGGGQDFKLARYTITGTLDTTFGASGKVVIDMGSFDDSANAVALQTDGKIVTAGSGADDFKLARFTTTGALDTSFGTSGRVTTDFLTGQDSANALVIQPDGKIVAAGTVFMTDHNVFGLARYNTNGTPDLSFGIGGKVTTNVSGFTNRLNGLALQSDGKLVAAGTINGGSFGIVRYNVNGTVDTTFGTAGTVTYNFNAFFGSDQAQAVLIQPDGKIVVAGDASFIDFALARFNANGSVDASFGTNGQVLTDFGMYESINSIARQADGKLVVAGTRDNSSNVSFALARYNTNGTLDTTFGLNGKLTTDFGDFSNDRARAVVVQTDGKIVAGGTSGPGFGSGSFAIARYADTNTSQTTFSISGQTLSADGHSLSNAVITLSGSSSQSKTTDQNGFYKFTGLTRGGNYNVSASYSISSSADCGQGVGKACFTPSQYSFANLQQDLFAQDFTVFAPTVTVSGRITNNGSPVVGVEVSTCVPILGRPGSCFFLTSNTNNNGNYTLANLPVLNSYNIEPSSNQFIFDPADYFFGDITNDVLGANFSAAHLITIGGKITNVNGRGLQNIQVNLFADSFSEAKTTDSNGSYQFSVAAGGNYTVSPSDTRVQAWLPSNQTTHTNLTQSVTNDDFQARFPTFTVSGTVRTTTGLVFPNAHVLVSGGATADLVTNGSGAYTSNQLNVLGDYVFTPQPFTSNGTFYNSFSPANLSFVSILICDPQNLPLGAQCSGFDYLGMNFTASSTAIPITITTNPAGRAVSIDGGPPVTSPPPVQWIPGSQHTIATTSPQAGATGTQYLFSNWSDGGAISHTVTAPATPTTYTANFTTQFQLTMSAGSGGTVQPASGFFNSGQSVQIIATPNSGFSFSGWTGNGTGSFTGPTNPVNITMNGPITQTAAFVVANSIQLSATGFSANEGAARIDITVSRGNATGAASVDYASSDSSGTNNCGVINGTASSRCDYLITLGTLPFAVGETTKTISIPIVDDVYVEGNETFTITLSNPVGATLGTPSSATLTIIDNDSSAGAPNPIDAANFFVLQHYVDFLNREADPSGLAFWTNEITSCGSNTQCVEIKRINVSAAFFLSIEFQETGYLVYRLYKSGLGNLPGAPVPVSFLEFLRDTQRIGKGVQVGTPGWEAILEANKQAYALGFVQRTDFLAAFPISMTADQFVSKLDTNAGNVLSPTEKANLVALLGATPSDPTKRSQVLRMVAEDNDLFNGEFNKAFVLMQYFGYLRRSPNDAPDTNFDGFNFWLGKLNSFGGNFINAEMVKSFLLSTEYRNRFGP